MHTKPLEHPTLEGDLYLARISLDTAHRYINRLRNTRAPQKRLRHTAESMIEDVIQILIAIEEAA